MGSARVSSGSPSIPARPRCAGRPTRRTSTRSTRSSLEGLPRRPADVQDGHQLGRPGGEHAQHLPLQEPHRGPVARRRRPSTARASSRASRSAAASMHNCMTGCIVSVQQHRPRRRRQLQDERPRVRDAHAARRELRDRLLGGGRRRSTGCATRSASTRSRPGAAIAILMDSGGMEWGDAEACEAQLLKEIAEGTELGQGDRQRRRRDGQAHASTSACRTVVARRSRPGTRGRSRPPASPTPRARWAPITRPA